MAADIWHPRCHCCFDGVRFEVMMELPMYQQSSIMKSEMILWRVIVQTRKVLLFEKISSVKDRDKIEEVFQDCTGIIC